MIYKRTYTPYTDNLYVVKYERVDLFGREELFSLVQVDTGGDHALGQFEKWLNADTRWDSAIDTRRLPIDPADDIKCGWYACTATDKLTFLEFLWAYNASDVVPGIDDKILRLKKLRARVTNIQHDL